MVDGRHVCPFSSWYLPVRYASSASVTWLVCSAWEFTETRATTLLTKYVFQCIHNLHALLIADNQMGVSMETMKNLWIHYYLPLVLVGTSEATYC